MDLTPLFETMKKDQLVNKLHLAEMIQLYLRSIFNFQQPNPFVFDGIMIQYFQTDVLHLVNENKAQTGYTLVVDMNKVNLAIEKVVKERVFDIRYQQARPQIDWNAIGLMVTVVSTMAALAFMSRSRYPK
jgi:hypothetical protein